MSQTFELTHTFRFEAAHSLPHVPADHKCRRLHGHSFSVDVIVRGELDPKLGWLVDYGDIKAAVAPLREQLDHYHLNEIAGLENPTSENLAIWIWDRLQPGLPLLHSLTVRETCNNACTYFGGGDKLR
ncbi:MAG: 6-carboxytetrahydropterin synthase QueD [Planctomycetota bacterium]